ncbi:hypothetical protein Ddye_024492 [Dipteronia dyeriana]|uniref:Uncharacterized protein n=1 Tax=Dipteronia dyeriana TaxID=168575 RepID=A0AAD9TUY1_9ROSI|nr:hypothetical protein Ddye_024492 [Dipteronia dyeriana]
MKWDWKRRSLRKWITDFEDSTQDRVAVLGKDSNGGVEYNRSVEQAGGARGEILFTAWITSVDDTLYYFSSVV